MRDQRWQDWFTSLAGLFVFFATWIIPSTLTATWALWILGGAIAVVGLSSLANPHRWEESVEVVLGLCLMASPHVLGFNDATALTWAAAVAGAIVVVFSGWALFSDDANISTAEW
ncbi:SPW repeat domain-containing protein [Mesorhizobium captivum]|uniref:SPW repeat domain-containing protein n=1 Tax=Mesorhizobium captivum TaxID=3072319 RepID=UPI002A23D2D2|nr:SPW repeat protein [Mesorhizobium sp. VK3C]MDX8449468.1 SPW repeat protein [Mesorhizobium sp. VK3C]